ncbi:hypothetical protein BJ508DRAFT_364033 [Ascobolus immersus RN42]|uniref:Uncharacterized protein n=1 Tax=Ascobolus immersus RN42 TaxID=1160509 RepID=A0A3N4I1E2_ASCIM|nr:hypothetical protein BJ508DRAFT_364033 [Ascobolus immersus RN42]
MEATAIGSSGAKCSRQSTLESASTHWRIRNPTLETYYLSDWLLGLSEAEIETLYPRDPSTEEVALESHAHPSYKVTAGLLQSVKAFDETSTASLSLLDWLTFAGHQGFSSQTLAHPILQNLLRLIQHLVYVSERAKKDHYFRLILLEPIHSILSPDTNVSENRPYNNNNAVDLFAKPLRYNETLLRRKRQGHQPLCSLQLSFDLRELNHLRGLLNAETEEEHDTVKGNELAHFLKETRMMRPQKLWLLYTVALQAYSLLRNEIIPAIHRLNPTTYGPYAEPAKASELEKVFESLYTPYINAQTMLVFIWHLRAPSIEQRLIDYCPDAPAEWKSGFKRR